MSPRKIGVTELALRDAHQSLIATRMAMEDMVDACADIDAAGYWSAECWGGATFDSCIRFLNEDPWERLRTFRKLMPHTRLQMLLRGQNLLGYRHYADDVVDKFVEKSAENGMDVFRVFDALNDPRNLEHAMKAVKKTGKHAQGTICYTTSPIHTPESFVKQADRLIDMGADSIAFKDMAALLKPQPAYDIIKGIKENHPDVQINLHCHSTTGVTLVTLQKAIEAGVDVVDTAISSMSLGPGHNPTESLVEMLEGTEYTTGLDMDRLIKIRDHFKKVRPKYKKFESKTLVNTDIFKSQIPGGMLSNMESQLAAQGAADRTDEVMKEVPRVRKDAGYPPLVTPSSQIVGTQAVFNVLMGNGEYKTLTAEFADLMLGYYGQPIGDLNPDLIKRAEEQTGKKPITCRPADLIDNEWDELVSQTSELEGFDGTDEDVLTNALFPGVAPKFFKERPQGPKSVAMTEAQLKAEAEGSGPSGVQGPVNYSVTVGGRSHDVTVEPA
ncbi:methylmalonyl-CoA carboxytransferase subunit 5S [Acidipropionibacterium jensenii]|uniref:methylmalonyl-CoA carboxytransferase subunit 5S n=1 Tax=Acidipropionibacterium jensenii TaxID=1749 RepID=UPI00214C4065|nr:methylmalonyl-CoA carboxytransferase subunit 5S [Acidipropionibacterium jensenii]